MPVDIRDFRQVWLVDMEFSTPPGERPDPICVVSREWITGNTIEVWQDELKTLQYPPYPTGPDSLFIAYYASAELACHLVLGWPLVTTFPSLNGALHRNY